MDVKLLDVTSWGSLEICAVGILMGYLIVWVIGHRQNRAIATHVMDEVTAVFKRQFAQVGDVHEDAADVFTLYGTGRSHVEGAQATLTLCPRHDFLGRFLINQVMPTPDSLLIEITGIDIQDLLCFCFTRSSLVKYQQERFTQLATITKTRAVGSFKDKLPLVSLADSSDAAEALAGPDSPLGSLPVESASLVQCVYVNNKRLIAELSLPKSSGLAAAVEAVLWTAQTAATLRLNEKSRKEATEARAKDDSKKKAEEEARAEKFAERRAEKIKAMTAEQRERLREKEEKKQSVRGRIRKL